MALPRFFDRVATSASGALGASRMEIQAVLEHVVPGLLVGELVSPNAQWIEDLAVNLLARLYPRLALMGTASSVARLRRVAIAINPAIEFVERASPGMTVSTTASSDVAAICVSADGWVARVDATHQWGPANPYAAGAAACLAVGEVFRRAFGLTSSESPCEPCHVSLLDFSSGGGAGEALNAADVGPVAYVGLGAVGSAGVWALARHQGLRGTLWLIDEESIELSNLQRYATARDRDIGRAKVEIAARELASTELRLRRRPIRLDRWAESTRDRTAVVSACVSVDTVDVRREVQALLPKLVINGWTGDAALGASSHVFGETACLACLYHPSGPTPSQTEIVAKELGLDRERTRLLWVLGAPVEPADVVAIAKHLRVVEEALAPWLGRTLHELHHDVVCGSAVLHLQGAPAPRSVPLAHQSALAGILMAAELVKRTADDLAPRLPAERYVVIDDVRKRKRGAWAFHRAKATGCICGDEDYLACFRDKWLAS